MCENMNMKKKRWHRTETQRKTQNSPKWLAQNFFMNKKKWNFSLHTVLCFFFDNNFVLLLFMMWWESSSSKRNLICCVFQYGRLFNRRQLSIVVRRKYKILSSISAYNSTQLNFVSYFLSFHVIPFYENSLHSRRLSFPFIHHHDINEKWDNKQQIIMFSSAPQHQHRAEESSFSMKNAKKNLTSTLLCVHNYEMKENFPSPMSHGFSPLLTTVSFSFCSLCVIELSLLELGIEHVYTLNTCNIFFVFFVVVVWGKIPLFTFFYHITFSVLANHSNGFDRISNQLF